MHIEYPVDTPLFKYSTRFLLQKKGDQDNSVENYFHKQCAPHNSILRVNKLF